MEENIEIIKNMGTNMSEADYQRLCGDDNLWEISESEARLLINAEFGFEVSRIRIIYEVATYKNEEGYAKTYQKYKRKPQNCATDCNYVRFDVAGWQYEMVNGYLNIYND